MKTYTDEGLREFQKACWSAPLRDVSTELLAARRELAELREDAEEHDAVIARRDIETATLRAQVSEFRERCAALDERPLREGDEYITDGGRLLRHRADRNALNPRYRIVRVPVAAASEPEKAKPWRPKIGDRVRFVGSAKTGTVDRLDRHDCTRVKFDGECTPLWCALDAIEPLALSPALEPAAEAPEPEQPRGEATYQGVPLQYDRNLEQPRGEAENVKWEWTGKVMLDAPLRAALRRIVLHSTDIEARETALDALLGEVKP